MAPDDDVAVAVLTNSYEAPAGAIASRLLRTMLTAPPAVATVAPTLVGAVAAPSPTPVAAGRRGRVSGMDCALQAGRPDYAQMTPDFRRFMDAAMVPRARDALEPLGVPQSVAIGGRSERGGFVVTGGAIRFATRSVYAVMFQAPDGRVAEFLLFPYFSELGRSARRSRVPPALLFFLERAPLHFPVAERGSRFDELDLGGDLVGCHVLARPRDDVVGRRLSAVTQHDHRLDLLALRGSIAAITHASLTAGCEKSLVSTSAGHTLKPDALIMRLTRSTKKK